MKKILALILVVFVCFTGVFADDLEYSDVISYVKSQFYPQSRESLVSQLNIEVQSLTAPENAVTIANGSYDYPVTPGDVYNVTYTNPSSNALVSQSISVDANYNVYIPYIGTKNVEGMTFVEFRDYAEAQMKSFYTYLNPQVSIISCGSFQVYVYGETWSTSSVSVWSFARLSDLCSLATDYASSRNVEVIDADGNVKTYDLLKACLLGDEENNPYLTPGSKVKFNTAEKTVWISGSVKLPGEYQLKEGETLSDLLTFARGFTNDANTSAVTVSNYQDGSYYAVSVNYDEQPAYELKDCSTVSVSSLNEIPATVTIQGAIQEEKMFYQFVNGETARHVINAIQGSLLTSADLDGIYVERDGVEIAVYSDSDVLIQEGDIIQIPYNRQEVLVSGAVQSPGKYTYEPGRNVEYYINLAGGYTESAKLSTLKVVDSNGFKIDKDSAVMPGYTISVDVTNNTVRENITFGITVTTFAISIFNFVMGLCD